MRTIWQALAWKEWHEQKWKLASITAILFCCVVVACKGREPQVFSFVRIAILLPMIPLSLLIATSSATSERSRGTMPFLLALPVSPRRIAVTKLLSGLGTCLLPVFVTLIGMYVWYLNWNWIGVSYESSMSRAAREMPGPFGFSDWFLSTGSVVALWVLSMFLWTAASGVSRADEVSAAAVTLTVIASIWILAIGGASLWQDQIELMSESQVTRLVALGLAALPGGFAQASMLPKLGLPIAIGGFSIYAAIHGGLAAWFVSRYGRNLEQRTHSQRVVISHSAHGWLSGPRQSCLTAIAWKQLRESGPLVLAGLAGVAIIAIAALFALQVDPNSNADWAIIFLAGTFFGFLYLGGFTALVVGIGVFLRDLAPGIHTFWRSRPIPPNAWYWIKYATGAIIVVLSFQLPMLVILLVASMYPDFSRSFDGGVSPLQLMLLTSVAYVAIYTVAVAMTTLMRSAVYAVVLTFAAFYLGAISIAGIAYLLQQLFHLDGLVDYLGEHESWPFWTATLLCTIALGSLVGHFAIRHDWGWKSRY